mmetsp:Transcript_49085/g.113434  ORF Transcript_49085/g.113434 Transcript_49085/m.113434 type:complete len:449 (+) Transcript_49085:398-1744(+)
MGRASSLACGSSAWPGTKPSEPPYEEPLSRGCKRRGCDLYSARCDLVSLGDRVDGRGDVPDVTRRHAGHRNAPIARDVDGVLSFESLHLLGGEARETEHADLRSHVAPVSSAARRLERRLQGRAHVDDPPRHRRTLCSPLRLEHAVGQHRLHDARPSEGRARVHRPYLQLQLRLHACRLLLVGAEQRQHAHALPVQAEVLSEGLGEREAVAVGLEQAQREGVPLGVARREALVGRVEEEGEVGSRLEHGRQPPPLLLGWIDAGGVVRARVQQHCRALRRGRQVSEHAVVVEAEGLRVPVPVLAHFESGGGEDLGVVPPARVGQVERRALAEELGVELADQAARAGARQRLHGAHALTPERRRVRAKGETPRRADEAGQPGDAQVLFVHVGGDDPFLRRLDGREDPGRPLVRAVRSSRERDLVGARVLLELLDEAEDRVRGPALHVCPQ